MSTAGISVYGEGRLRGWLARAHSLPVETGLVLAFYVLYEASRGLVDNDYGLALQHAEDVAELERRLGIFIEGGVQDAVALVPGLDWLLAHAYVSLHLALTVLALAWIYRWHRAWFPLVRTGLVVASAIALLGYALYPTAPPRLAAGMGIDDTVSAATGVDLGSKLLSSVYNPYAAMPSMHLGYALIIGLVVARLAHRRSVRLAGALYPAFVLLAIVATGNHFLLDAVAGALVALVGLAVATAVCRPRGSPSHRRALGWRVIEVAGLSNTSAGRSPSTNWCRSRYTARGRAEPAVNPPLHPPWVRRHWWSRCGQLSAGGSTKPFPVPRRQTCSEPADDTR